MDDAAGGIQQETLAAIRLSMPDNVYQRVKHAAVDARTNASAWIRDAIAERLDRVPDDEGLAELVGKYDALNETGRGLLLDLARLVANSPSYRKAGRREYTAAD